MIPHYNQEMRRRRSKYALALWLGLPIDLLASFGGMVLLAVGVHGGGVFTIFGEVLCPAYRALIRIVHYAFPTDRFFAELGFFGGHVPLCFLVQLPYYYVLVLMGLAIRAKLRPPVSAHCCEECGYNLTGNVSGICPECGTPVTRIQPDRASAQSPSDTHSDKRRKRTAIRLALAVIAAIMLTVGTFWLYHRPISFDKGEW
ncbi:MAG: hypothetical protein V3T70_09180, partial [Phycisphaerae bacterium]